MLTSLYSLFMSLVSVIGSYTEDEPLVCCIDIIL